MSGLDTDLERRVVATLQVKAGQLVGGVEPFDPALPAPIAPAKPHPRRLLVIATLAAVLVLTAAALLVVIGGGGDDHRRFPPSRRSWPASRSTRCRT